MNRDGLVAILNRLLASLYDAENGYTVSGDNATSPELVAFFNLARTTRGELIDEISAEVRRLGGHPAGTGTAGGLLSRAWTDIKGMLSGREDLPALESCLAMEEATVREYDDALRADLPSDVREVLSRHRDALSDSRDRVRDLVEDFRDAQP